MARPALAAPAVWAQRPRRSCRRRECRTPSPASDPRAAASLPASSHRRAFHPGSGGSFASPCRGRPRPSPPKCRQDLMQTRERVLVRMVAQPATKHERECHDCAARRIIAWCPSGLQPAPSWRGRSYPRPRNAPGTDTPRAARARALSSLIATVSIGDPAAPSSMSTCSSAEPTCVRKPADRRVIADIAVHRCLSRADEAWYCAVSTSMCGFNSCRCL